MIVLAYAIMSNHFHIFIYVPEPEDIGAEKARRGYAFMYGNADDWDVIRDSHEKSMREAMSEILAAREAERAEREAKGESAPSRRTDPPPSKADPGWAMPLDSAKHPPTHGKPHSPTPCTLRSTAQPACGVSPVGVPLRPRRHTEQPIRAEDLCA